jgi:hypothetical protein
MNVWEKDNLLDIGVQYLLYPPFTHRRRFYYDEKLAKNVADRDYSQEKRSGVFISLV